MSPIKCLLLSAALLTGSALAAQPLLGQSTPAPLSGPQFGAGWVGNAPDALMGGMAYVVLPKIAGIGGGLGIFVDYKTDFDSPENDRGFNSSLTSQDLENDPDRERLDFIKDEASFTSVNAGLVRPVTPWLMAYVGGGITTKKRYEIFNVAQDDPAGVGGLVVVENPERETTKANLMAGVFMRLSSLISTQFGFETQPQGVTIGVSLRLPRW